mmetsp:Transcript_1473/g.2630  ORF Transcript_1473/g.2630 Transcript_1473/m.2630 type:complete len:390 (+) Transcript_1473:60-1229(+)
MSCDRTRSRSPRPGASSAGLADGYVAESQATSELAAAPAPTLAADQRTLEISAVLVSGNVLNVVHASPQEHGFELKRRFAEATGTPVRYLRLLFAGQEISDDRTLAESGLEDGQVEVQLIRLPPPDVPSLLAIPEDDPLLVPFLLDCAADPDEVDESGWTALHWAVLRHHNAVAEALLAHPDFTAVCAVDIGKMTALHLAAQEGLANLCRKLAANMTTASLNARAANGSTALHLAARNRHADVCEVLLDLPNFEALNDQNGRGWTALHYAAAGGLVDLCNRLLGMDSFTAATELTINGETALHWAAVNGHVEICQHLLRRIDADVEDVDGLTAVESAANGGQKAVCALFTSSSCWQQAIAKVKAAKAVEAPAEWMRPPADLSECQQAVS